MVLINYIYFKFLDFKLNYLKSGRNYFPLYFNQVLLGTWLAGSKTEKKEPQFGKNQGEL